MEQSKSELDQQAIEKTAALAKRLETEVLGAFVGNPQPVRLAVLGLLSGLHLLVEDIPGVGKTTLALALARSAGLDFSRIQFTPDLIPGDVLGMNIWDAEKREFRFRSGPIHAHFILADEMNRASPRTQAAFLEAMQEGQVSIEGRTIELPEPFFLFATQNPQNFVGTFPLPEAELDRFGLSCSIGYPDPEDESRILDLWKPGGMSRDLHAVCNAQDILEARRTVFTIAVHAEVREYIVQLIRSSRSHSELRLGASPRAGIFLQQAAKTEAAMHGRSYVIPEDVETVAVPVLSHRLVLSSQARLSGTGSAELVKKMLSSIRKPTGL